MKRRVEVEDKGKEKETPKNIVSRHKISSHRCTFNDNEGKNGKKTRGATNTSLVARGADTLS